MEKPINPYRKGTFIWSIFEGDWEDLTIEQIGEVFDRTADEIREVIHRIKRKTGYDVPRRRTKQT